MEVKAALVTLSLWLPHVPHAHASYSICFIYFISITPGAREEHARGRGGTSFILFSSFLCPLHTSLLRNSKGKVKTIIC